MLWFIIMHLHYAHILTLLTIKQDSKVNNFQKYNFNSNFFGYFHSVQIIKVLN